MLFVPILLNINSADHSNLNKETIKRERSFIEKIIQFTNEVEQKSQFEGGTNSATLRFPEDFPNMPPKITFKCEMFHEIVFFILWYLPQWRCMYFYLASPYEDPMNSQERLDYKELTMEIAIMSVKSMLADPSANVDAAKIFREKKQDYNKKIRELPEKSVSF